MPRALFFHRYYELIRTAADARFADSHSDQKLSALGTVSLRGCHEIGRGAPRLDRLAGFAKILPKIERLRLRLSGTKRLARG